MDQYSYISNAHSNYIEELYRAYKDDPQSVDESWQKFFEGFEFSLTHRNGSNGNGQAAPAAPEAKVGTVDDRELAVRKLIRNYRRRGHLESNTNPVRQRKDRKAQLNIEFFGLTEADLDVEFDAGEEIGIGRATLRRIVSALREIYVEHIGFEYTYIRERDMMEFIKYKAEHDALSYVTPVEDKKRILSKLNEAVVFENFLHTKYIGQKRFSLEGSENTIPALDATINKGAEMGVEEIIIGMAHRGRLNVLANIMGKTYEQIFNEFENKYEPNLAHGDGDVKYHLGYSSQIKTPSGKTVDVKLSPNPSHLEAVNPVVEGFARAKYDSIYNKDLDKVMPILIHGDAALAGQGIVYEVAQMSKLEGYNTGGTIHFIINNQIGFTTDFEDARSSIYSSDVAKVIDSPVMHVNGDYPEAVIFCMKTAVEFRQKFHRDVFIDMVSYRKHGHNESDEPKFTQPSLYQKISKHPNPRDIYTNLLIERNEVDAKLAKSMDKEFRSLLQDRLNMVKQEPLPYYYQPLEKEWKELRHSTPKDFNQSPETGISEEMVNRIGEALVKLPEGFKPIKQIEKQLKQRQQMFFETKELNWAGGELLAYGSLMLENKLVRLSGQDTRRGTFSHRHSVLYDAETGSPYTSLNYIQDEQEKMYVYNSLLSEFGVLGFEYGYSMANPNALTVWEAQFGDFSNGAQVIIDQFIASAESKWRRMSGLVMLLPHGYEGQGPEHSSARLERFLQLCGDYNMIVANITEPANFFHALRRQLAWPFRKPLIVVSPKSLLRHPKVVSPVKDFLKGGFREVIGDSFASPMKNVKRVLLCSGKIYLDLLERQEAQKRKDVAIIRVEQLHPLPTNQIDKLLVKYKGAEIIWVQEEPENMGAWSFILRYYQSWKLISRDASASPAVGYSKTHNKEQEDIVDKAFQ